MIQNTAEKLSAIIKEKGYKQYAVAEKAGMSPRDFSNIIHGRKTFRADYVLPICQALDITPNELFDFNRR